MSAENLPYFKFITEIIRNGLWANLSTAARTLYPALLSFSDGHFKPVYPGTKVLLKLTGFKHKATLRKARKELADKGLLAFSAGNGRANTYYHFRFDLAPQRELTTSPRGAPIYPPEGSTNVSTGEAGYTSRGEEKASPHNQIHISIDNYPVLQETDSKSTKKDKSSYLENERWTFLERRFGKEAIDLARSECALGKIAANLYNVEKILYHFQGNEKYKLSWDAVRKDLAKHVSSTSLDLICQAFRSEENGLFIFEDNLPTHLRTLLEQVCPRVFFEPVMEERTEAVMHRARLPV